MAKRKPRKAPAGCFWRNGTLYGRIQTGGGDIKWSLRTDDPKVAASRRKAERARAIAAHHYGDQRRTFAETMEAWGRYIVNEVSPKTLTRYLSSLAVLQPHLEGLYLDQIDKKRIGAIVEARRDIPYVPAGKKHPIKVTTATIKRDLTALSSVFGYCVDEDWMESNPVMAWLKPGGRRKSRLQERRDPIVLPEHAHIEMVIDAAPGLFAEMIRAALKTGARLDELAKGQRQHFDQARKQLTVVGKRNTLRVIDLEDGGEDFGLALFSALPASMETKALFWHRKIAGKRSKGQRPAMPFRQVSSNFRRVVSGVAQKAQKQDQDFRPFTFHHLRHRAAVDWLKSGRSIYVLQKRLGHTSIKTTEMYLAYLTPEEAQIAMLGSGGEGPKTGARAAVSSGANRRKPL
jgi:integrase/recombinase XerD